MVKELVQVPVVHVRAPPTVEVPDMLGATVFNGIVGVYILILLALLGPCPSALTAATVKAYTVV